MLDFDIDIVYLYLDANDENWHKERIHWKANYKGLNQDGISQARFVNNDELRYSLRSLYKFVPWIRKVFIVTNSGTPCWLDTNNEKIVVVNQNDIVPKEYLPTFNTNVVETYLYKIEALSETFLYANDDMMFNSPVSKDFFFDENGYPIIRYKKAVSKKHIRKSIYAKSIMNMKKMIEQDFRICCPGSPHHNVDSYLKSVYKECIEHYSDFISVVSQNKFRAENDIQRALLSYYLAAIGKGVLRNVSANDGSQPFYKRILNFVLNKRSKDSQLIKNTRKSYNEILEIKKPKLFCINDETASCDEDRKRTRKFFEQYFSEKSEFEI
jgi:hypothetical protein